MNRKILIILAVALFIGFLIWLFVESTKPLPGQKQAYECSNFVDFSKLLDINSSDKCRVHVPIGTEVKYPTNPPTLGPHYADWIRAGVYDLSKDDRNLVHSLEHGYVIMSYKCEVNSDKTASASATPQNQKSCDEKKNQLAKIYEKQGKTKLIVVPRTNLDADFALTSWGYLDKFSNFDENRVNSFIEAHRYQGPEQTME